MNFVRAFWARRQRARALLQKEATVVKTTAHALEANEAVRRDLQEIRAVEHLRRAKPR